MGILGVLAAKNVNDIQKHGCVREPHLVALKQRREDVAYRLLTQAKGLGEEYDGDLQGTSLEVFLNSIHSAISLLVSSLV